MVVVITTYKKAQGQTKEKKEVKTSIIINDGDTTVNGKKFKNLSEDAPFDAAVLELIINFQK